MARCPSCGGTPSLTCNCAIVGSDGIQVTGSGSGANPHTVAPIIDPADANLLEERSTGLYISGAIGELGYEEVTSSQSGITSAVIAGLIVTATVGTGRTIYVEYFSPGAQFSAVNESWAFEIREGSNVLQARYHKVSAAVPAETQGGGVTKVRLQPTPGAHIYRASLSRATGAGTATHIAAGNAPAYISVKDAGPI